MTMTDDELAEFIGVKGNKWATKILAGLTPKQRATYENMSEVETKLDLWMKGAGPKPAGVVVCRRRGR